MSYTLGEQYKVYIESSKGDVMEIPAVFVQITTGGFPDFQEVTILLKTIEAARITKSKKDDWLKSVERRRALPEWKCDYCGRANSRKKEVCTSCGAVRSFIYEG